MYVTFIYLYSSLPIHIGSCLFDLLRKILYHKPLLIHYKTYVHNDVYGTVVVSTVDNFSTDWTVIRFFPSRVERRRIVHCIPLLDVVCNIYLEI